MLKNENIESHEIMTGMNMVGHLRPLFIDLEAEQDGCFRADSLFLSLCCYEESIRGKDITITEKCLKTFVTKAVLNMLFSHLDRWPSIGLAKETYETALGCGAATKRF